MIDPLRSPKLWTWHLDRSAFVYVRQSTPQQVLDHQESTAHQYALAGRFRANQERLEANRARQDQPGAPRQGASLLAGLLSCVRCGRRMMMLYSGPKNRHDYTSANGLTGYGESLCQSLAGPVLDELIATRVLAAVDPAALEASLAAVAGVERERSELARQWHLRRERADHEVERAPGKTRPASRRIAWSAASWSVAGRSR